MTRTVIRSAVTALLATGLLAATAAPATGSDTVAAHHLPEGGFTLAVEPEGGGVRTSVKLRCPDGGTHPDPRAACADLAGVDGRVADIEPRSGICTRQYEPVTVSAYGLWRGLPRAYKEQFANRCEAVHATGGNVFDF